MRFGPYRLVADGAPALVAILNITEDSFSGDGLAARPDGLAMAVERAVLAGADLLDVGAESTRPGASAVDASLERARVVTAIQTVRALTDLPIAVDTRRAGTAVAALEAGAVMVNDTSGRHDAEMAEVVAAHHAGWVLMHAPHAIGDQGWSAAVEAMPTGVDAGVAQVAADLEARVRAALEAGVPREQLALDPGIGFGKTVAQNLAFLRAQHALASLALPVYLGPSRKSALGAITGTAPDDRLGASAAATAAAVFAGARFVRVHDVAEMRQALDVAWAIHRGDERAAAARGRPWEIWR
ncbi:MAG: hypothetical protein RIT45_111 [Pseudomonadota bacterium]